MQVKSIPMKHHLIIWFMLSVLLLSAACKKNKQSDDMPSDPNSKYLLFNESRLEQLRSEAHTSRAEIWTQIYEFVEDVRTGNNQQIASVPPEQPPAGSNQNFFRDHGDALSAMALSSIISEDAAQINLTVNYLMAVCAWEVWDIPRNDLGHIHIIISVSLAYSWMQDYLDAEQKAFIEERLGYWTHERYMQATAPYNSEQNNWWTHSYLQNHCGSNYAAIGIAALALKEADSRSQDWLNLAVAKWERIRFLLNSIGDGTWHEGVSYQWYQMETALPFLLALRQKTGQNLLPDTQLKALSEFRSYNHLPGNYQWMMPYGDVSVWESGHTAPPALLRIIAAEYNDVYAAYTAEELLQAGGRYSNVWAFPYAVYEFLFYDPDVELRIPDAGSHSLSHFFTDAEAAVWRSSWDADALIFGIKAGPYGGRFGYDRFHAGEYPFDEAEATANVGHDHRDAGSFWIAKGADWLLPEDVQYEGYETSLHNTLLIDGQGQAIYSQGNPGYDALTRGEKNDAKVNDIAGDQTWYEYIETDLSRAYAYISGVNQVKRYAVYLRPNVWIIIDDTETSGQLEVSHLIHAENSITNESSWLNLQSENGALLKVQTISPTDAQVHIDQTSYGMPEARMKAQGTDVRMCHLYYAAGSYDAGQPDALLSDENEQGIALRIDFENGSRTKLFLNVTGTGMTPSVSPITLAGQTFSSRLLIIFYDDTLDEIHRIEY
jgi:hypothetical protein